MRYIDGTRYISAGEYAELKMISKGRVSQLKSKLPFEKFEDLGVELINYDKLELDLDERQLMDIRHSSKAPVHQYTYKELGKFFSKLLGEMTRSTEEAIEAKQIAIDELDTLKSELFKLTQEKEVLEQSLQVSKEQNEELVKEKTALSEAIKTLKQEKDILERQHEEWKSRHQAITAEKDLLLTKVLQLQEENTVLVVKVTKMETATQNNDDLRTEFKALKDIVTKLLSNTEK